MVSFHFHFLVCGKLIRSDGLAEANSRPKNQHRYNVAQQQQVYKSEIERIWRAQFRSLSNKTPPELTVEEALAPMYKQPRESAGSGAAGAGVAHNHNAKTSGSGSGTKSRHSSLGAFSRGSSVDRDQGDNKSGTRVLRIRRQAVSLTYPTDYSSAYMRNRRTGLGRPRLCGMITSSLRMWPEGWRSRRRICARRIMFLLETWQRINV
jgi:hypothetical protein